jgi:hypothetical protein
MSFNILNEQMSSETASLKLWLEGSGSLIVPPTNSSIHTTNFIQHGYLSDQLIWQVGFTISFSGGGTTTGLMTPWASADGQTDVTATLDSNFLYVTGYAQTAGSTTLQYTLNYYYRLLVP